MKNPRRNAARWLRQAEHDLVQADRMLAAGVFSYAAFFAEQAAQKALKAFLLAQGKRLITTHSVGQLAREAAARDKRFDSLIDPGKRLDRHYLTARYPDALPEPAIPAEAYTPEDAEEAIQSAGAILEAARAAIPPQ